MHLIGWHFISVLLTGANKLAIGTRVLQGSAARHYELEDEMTTGFDSQPIERSCSGVAAI